MFTGIKKKPSEEFFQWVVPLNNGSMHSLVYSLPFPLPNSFITLAANLLQVQDLALPEGKHSGLTHVHRASVGVWEPALPDSSPGTEVQPGTPWAEPKADWRHRKFSTGLSEPYLHRARSQTSRGSGTAPACLQRCILSHNTEQTASKWQNSGWGELLDIFFLFFLIYFFKRGVLEKGRGGRSTVTEQ